MARPPLSAVVIAFNEERKIEACLRSVSFADEIVVVDSGSSDRTRELASGLGARVVVQPFLGHVEQKNFALGLATNDWVLSVDADEVVSPELRAAIEAALPAPEADGYRINRRTWYLGAWIRHSGWYPDPKLRLFRRSLGTWGGVNPHDRVELRGRTARLSGDLLHYSYDDLADHLAKLDAYSTIMAREARARGERFSLVKLALHPPLRFLKAFVLKAGFLDGFRGLVLARMAAAYVHLRHVKIWEMERAASRPADPAAPNGPDPGR